MFNWSGHQSRLVKLVCMTGHLPARSSVFASMFLSDYVLVWGLERYVSHPNDYV